MEKKIHNVCWKKVINRKIIMIREGLKKWKFFDIFSHYLEEGFFFFFKPFPNSLKYFKKNLDIITLPGNHQLEESDACLFNTVPYSILHYTYIIYDYEMKTLENKSITIQLRPIFQSCVPNMASDWQRLPFYKVFCFFKHLNISVVRVDFYVDRSFPHLHLEFLLVSKLADLQYLVKNESMNFTHKSKLMEYGCLEQYYRQTLPNIFGLH